MNLDWERPPPLAEESEQRRTHDYTGWLVAGYLSVPLLVVGLPLVVSEGSNDGVFSAAAFGVGLASGVLMPGVVHLLHGDSARGLRAWGGVAAAAAGGVVVGFFAGMKVGEAQDDGFGEDTDLLPFMFGAWGALIGAGIGVAGWAIYDVADSAVPSRASAEPSAAISFGLAPSPAGLSASVGGRF